MIRREVDRGAWEGRPWAAASLRALVALLPITMSIAATWFVSQQLPPVDSFIQRVGLWVLLSLLATVVLLAVDRVARRLLPLAALLKLSLVFPDQAPNRFRVALRTGTVRQLQDHVEHIKEHGFDPDEVRAAEELLELIAALSAHDRMTRGHAERVRAYSRMIGEELKLSADDLDRLHWAGLLHDVGKLFVPAEILNKEGRLTDEEYEIIKAHPGWGAKLCEPLRPWLGEWVDAVGQHHERWDGKGYPNGLAGAEISLAARIVSVADVFDVITSARSYKEPMSAVDGRMELTRCAGTQFDPEVVRAFLTVGLGRLRLVMGPLSWVAQLPVIGRVPVGPALGAAGSAAATAVAVLVGGLLHEPEPAPMRETAATVPAEAEAEARPTPLADPPDALAEDPVVEADPLAAPSDEEPIATVPTTEPEPEPAPADPEPEPEPEPGPEPRLAAVPVAVDDTATVAEDGTVVIDVLANDTDDDGDTLTVTSVATAAGSATTDGASVTYTPDPDAVGAQAVGYTVDDGTGNTATALVTVTVTPTADVPVAADDVATVAEDGSVVVSVLTNDDDIDGDTLTVTAASSPDGTATTNGTTVTYAPAADALGTHTVTYTVDDGTGLTDTASITVTVTPMPDAPVAADDVATVAEDGSVVVSVLANDDDIDGDALTVTSASSADGTATTDGTTVTYAPAADSNGTHTVTYTVDDGTGLTDTASITVTVTPTADAPVAVDDVATVAEDGTVVVSVLGNDDDIDGDSLTVTGASSADGTATTDGTTVTYSPAADSNGSHIVSYTVDDGSGLTDTATVTVTVTPVNDAPSFTAGADVSVAEDSGARTLAGWATGLAAGPADEASQTVTFSATAADPSLFDVAPAINATGTLTFTPAGDAHGTTTVSVQAADDGGTTGGGVDTSATQSFSITVTPVADAPVAGDDAYVTSVAIPLVVPAPGVLGNDGDEDGDDLTTSLTIDAGGGIVALLPDGSFVYTPLPLFSGTDTFTYTVTDGTLTDTGTVTIQVDSTTTQTSLYLGTSGSSPDDWGFVTSPPPGTGTEADTDGDGNPGLTLKNSNQKLTNQEGKEYQQWSVVTPTNLVLDGPATLQLWSTSANFHPDHPNDWSVWLEDCAADGTGCVVIASSLSVHVASWNDGVSDWVYKEIGLGDVSHTVTAGRMLRMRLMTDHNDLWVASSAVRPSALVITQP